MTLLGWLDRYIDRRVRLAMRLREMEREGHAAAPCGEVWGGRRPLERIDSSNCRSKIATGPGIGLSPLSMRETAD